MENEEIFWTQREKKAWCERNRFWTYQLVRRCARGNAIPGSVKIEIRSVLECDLKEDFKKARDREKSILEKQPRLFSLSNRNDLGKRSGVVVMRKAKKPIEKEIQKSKVRVLTYESQLGLTKLKSKWFVSGCGEQYKSL